LRSALNGIIGKREIDEVKFVEIKSHSSKVEAAREFTYCAVEDYASKAKIRIDVLTWDMQDSRHAVQGRDNVANLEYMYHKVLTHVGRQWMQAEWGFYPDTNSQIGWNKIANALSKTRLIRSKLSMLRLFDDEETSQVFQFKDIVPKESCKEPLIQLADLFAGMARFTREEGKQCIHWLDKCKNKNQIPLASILSEKDVSEDTTITRQNRFQLIDAFDKLCKRHKMRVSLRTKNCLWTPDPKYPINFWHYESQHQDDKAPVK
jgi:hypothetical protein